MHWADSLASELDPERKHVLATGITPSGPIHVGNLREVLTTEAVHRAALDRGLDAELIYIGDTFDPLRKVYPFLDKDTYKPHVGKPLSRIPCPCGEDGPGHDSYAHHFLHPFLKALEELGVHPHVHLAHELYESGAYHEAIRNVFEHRDTIKTTLEEVSGRELKDTWVPFTAIHPDSGTFARGDPKAVEGTTLIFDGRDGEVKVDALRPGSGKLPWRLDWPARWSFLKVTFEAFGKDHGASGGSWDTARPLVQEVFDWAPPHQTMYEFIHLKGAGAMHSSTGTGVAATDILRAVPPEVLRFAILRPQPKNHIDFDPGAGLPDLVDEFDRWLRAVITDDVAKDMKEGPRVVELSMPDGEVPDHVPRIPPLRHIALVAQAHGTDGVWPTLVRTGEVDDGDEVARALVEERAEHVLAWLDTYAPERERFSLNEEPRPDLAAKAGEDGLKALGALVDRLDEIDASMWTGDALQDAAYEAAKDVDVGMRSLFQASYLALCGEKGGPRLGPLLESLGPERSLALLRGAVAGQTGAN